MKWVKAKMWWRTYVIKVYAFALAASAALGALYGISHVTFDAVTAILSWVVLFPTFILLDAVLRAHIIWCPLRAASLPLIQGYIIMYLISWQTIDPMQISILIAEGAAVISFIVSGIVALITRGSEK